MEDGEIEMQVPDSAVSVVPWTDLHMPSNVVIPATRGCLSDQHLFGEIFPLHSVLEKLSQHHASAESCRD